MGDGCPGCDEGYLDKGDGTPEEYLTEKGRGVFEAYIWLKNYNIWPVTGGLQDQPARFLKVVKFCDAVGAIYAEKIAEKEKEAKDFYEKTGFIKNG